MPESSGSNVNDSIGALLERIVDFREARDWAAFHSPRNLAVGLAVEAGELLEHFQWLPDGHDYTSSELHGISEELADVAIYLFELADALEIALPVAIIKKLEINSARYPVERARGRIDKHSDL